MPANPVQQRHVKGHKTHFRLRFQKDGAWVDLSGMTLRAGLESLKSTGASTASFKAVSVVALAPGTSGTLTAGTVSGTIPPTGFSFTGAAVLRVLRRVSAATGGQPTVNDFLGDPVPIFVVERSSNWIEL
jgi:hypothetical protein